MRRHPVIGGLIFLVLVAVFLAIGVRLLGLPGIKKTGLSFGHKIGVVNVEGIITDSFEITEQLEEFGRDDKIRAVVVRIESPGGGVVPSQEIHDAIVSLKRHKKVVASMGSVAASGGYLIACAADWIVASPGTITGSLSAVMHYANIEGLMKKLGLQAFVVKSGRYKDIGSPTRMMTQEEKDILQGVVDDSCSQFKEIIQINRKIPADRLMEITDGRIFTGRQAKSLGLVDELGGFDLAVRKAAKMAGLKGKPDLVFPPERSAGFWELLRNSMTAAMPGSGLFQGRNLSGLFYLYQP